MTTLSEKVRRHAETKRGSRDYTPDSFMMRYAKRYVARTGESWNDGVDNECNVRARVLSQLWYEVAVAPASKVWATKLGRWLISCVLAVAFLILLLVLSWKNTVVLIAGMTFLFIFFTAAYIGFVIADDGVKNARYTLRLYKRHEQLLIMAVVVLGLPVVAIVYLYNLLSRVVWGRIIILLVSVAGFCLFVGSAIVMFGWVKVLLSLAVVAGIIAVAAVIAVVVPSYFRYRLAVKSQVIKDTEKDAENFAFNVLQDMRDKAIGAGDTRNGVNWPQQCMTRYNDNLWFYSYKWTDVFKYLRNGEITRVEHILEPGNQDGSVFVRSLKEALDAQCQVTLVGELKKSTNRTSQLIKFLLAIIFSVKATVCKIVTLPPMEDVKD